jgi:hypothetical protein
VVGIDTSLSMPQWLNPTARIGHATPMDAGSWEVALLSIGLPPVQVTGLTGVAKVLRVSAGRDKNENILS